VRAVDEQLPSGQGGSEERRDLFSGLMVGVGMMLVERTGGVVAS